MITVFKNLILPLYSFFLNADPYFYIITFTFLLSICPFQWSADLQASGYCTTACGVCLDEVVSVLCFKNLLKQAVRQSCTQLFRNTVLIPLCQCANSWVEMSPGEATPMGVSETASSLYLSILSTNL